MYVCMLVCMCMHIYILVLKRVVWNTVKLVMRTDSDKNHTLLYKASNDLRRDQVVKLVVKVVKLQECAQTRSTFSSTRLDQVVNLGRKLR